ncbi:UNVERIFIED_ORG: hypothetical protein J2X79_001504 [Arthrobacter globiformis]|nr:hypothetical protein [Arthrobacter globiformis]
MAENKTRVTGVSADDFIEAVEHPVRLQVALRLAHPHGRTDGSGT